MTQCAFITQFGIYMREYRDYYLAVQMTAYGRSSSVWIPALLKSNWHFGPIKNIQFDRI